MTKEIKESNVSQTLGIVGICCSFLVPLAGIVCGIVGLSIKKNPNHYGRDIALNIISIVGAFFFW